jgi:hypothetical protein
MIIKQNVLLHLLILLVSIFFSLITTYFYFDKFAHGRYFGTLSAVNKIDRKIIEGIKNIEGIDLLADQKINSFKAIFEPLKCLAPAKIISKEQSDKTIYTNIPNEKERTTPGICLRYLYDFDNPNWGESIPVGEYEIKFGKYSIPEWSATYERWLRNPADWMQSWFNRYTIVFFTHAGFWYLLVWSLTLRSNEYYLSKELKPLLKDLEKKFKDDF